LIDPEQEVVGDVSPWRSGFMKEATESTMPPCFRVAVYPTKKCKPKCRHGETDPESRKDSKTTLPEVTPNGVPARTACNQVTTDSEESIDGYCANSRLVENVLAAKMSERHSV
jgi:hypothetical protein